MSTYYKWCWTWFFRFAIFITNKYSRWSLSWSTFFDKAFAFNIKQVLVFHFYEIIVNFNRLDKSARRFRQQTTMLLTVSHAKQLNLPPRHFRASLVSSPSHKYNKCRCMLLRVSSYKHALVKYQINKLSTCKIKKFQFYKWVQLCLLCCALWNFFSPYQDGHKNTNHSNFHKCCRAFGSTYVQR